MIWLRPGVIVKGRRGIQSIGVKFIGLDDQKMWEREREEARLRVQGSV